MIHWFPAKHAIRTTIAAVAIGGVAITPGHAVAKNHDLQLISLLRAVLSPHDHAPSPGTRTPPSR